MSQYDKLEGRTAELIQGALDGELSAVEQAELDSVLSESVAAQAQFDEFVSLARQLDTEPQVEPPEYLKNVILANVTLPAKPLAKEKTGLFSRWSDSFSMQSGFALTLAAVLVAGVYQMGSDPLSSADTSQMVGTVVPSPVDQSPVDQSPVDQSPVDQSPAPAPGELTNSIQINTDRLSGVVQLHRSENGMTLDFSLDSDLPNAVRVGLADTELRYTGGQTTDTERLNSKVSATEEAVDISSQGKLRTTLNLDQESPISATLPISLVLEFFVEGTPVHQAKLGFNGDIEQE